MADSKKYDGSQWEHSLRKLTTATEAVENPLYADGTAITNYTIKGNTVQNGTPTPSAPISVNGVGNKTANLTSTNTWKNADTTDTRSYFSARFYVSGGVQAFANVTQIGEYTLTLTGLTNETVQFKHNGSTRDILIFSYTANFAEPTDLTVSFYANGYNPTELNGIDLTNIMLNTGSTALDYEPYGFKIPILKDSQALTPIYLNEPLLKIGDYEDTLNSDGTVTRRIGKIDLGTRTYTKRSSGNFYFSSALSNVRIISNVNTGNGLCTHFAEVAPQVYASTPYSFCTCINMQATACFNATGFEGYTTEQFQEAMSGVYMYYVLATPTTETVTASSIPTTDGANTITVDTTVQPSEFTATWTGWHDSSVKEYDGTDWQ